MRHGSCRDAPIESAPACFGNSLQSCSDSAAAVTPADGVFGSDNYCIKATLIASAVLSVRAAIVNVGFAAPDVGKSEEPANQRL